MLPNTKGRNPMLTALSILFLVMTAFSLPFAAASCMSGIGLLDKKGFRLLAHFCIFFITLTLPIVLIACSAEMFFLQSAYSLAGLMAYVLVGAFGAAVDNSV